MFTDQAHWLPTTLKLRMWSKNLWGLQQSFPDLPGAASLTDSPVCFKLALIDDCLCSVKLSNFTLQLPHWNAELEVTWICSPWSSNYFQNKLSHILFWVRALLFMSMPATRNFTTGPTLLKLPKRWPKLKLKPSLWVHNLQHLLVMASWPAHLPNVRSMKVNAVAIFAWWFLMHK